MYSVFRSEFGVKMSNYFFFIVASEHRMSNGHNLEHLTIRVDWGVVQSGAPAGRSRIGWKFGDGFHSLMIVIHLGSHVIFSICHIPVLIRSMGLIWPLLWCFLPYTNWICEVDFFFYACKCKLIWEFESYSWIAIFYQSSLTISFKKVSWFPPLILSIKLRMLDKF